MSLGGLNLSVHIDNLLKREVDKTGIDKARALFIPGLDESPIELELGPIAKFVNGKPKPMTSRNKGDNNLDPMSRLESSCDVDSV